LANLETNRDRGERQTRRQIHSAPGKPGRCLITRGHLPGGAAPAAGAKRREKSSPPYGDKAAEGGGPALMRLAAGVERYKQSNKFGGRAEPTKGGPTKWPRMPNILKPIDLTARAIRRAVFAVLDGF
jgi:hypothetical protein